MKLSHTHFCTFDTGRDSTWISLEQRKQTFPNEENNWFPCHIFVPIPGSGSDNNKMILSRAKPAITGTGEGNTSSESTSGTALAKAKKKVPSLKDFLEARDYTGAIR